MLEMLEGRILKVAVATCQFPVDADVRRNRQYVLRQMRVAKEKGAHVAHFPEACISGYAGTDFKSYRGCVGACSKHARAKFSTWQMS
jgi:predicted amidohydrolase